MTPACPCPCPCPCHEPDCSMKHAVPCCGEAGKYQPLAWQVVTDAKGFERVHETDEDGRPGDLVADVFGDHAALVRAAPLLAKALRELLVVAGTPITDRQQAVFEAARAALSKATGEGASA